MNEVIIPPYLKKGDKVLLISPSSKIDKKLVRAMRARLTSWGLKPIIGKHALAKSGSFAGTIKQRTTDLQYGLDHKSIRAIFCTRGGYGMIQVLEQISLKRFLENPKWIIGYSDISGIHSLLSKHNIASIHGPMARHFALAPKEDLAIEFLKNTLRGESMKYIIKGHKFILALASFVTCLFPYLVVGANKVVPEVFLNLVYWIIALCLVRFIRKQNIANSIRYGGCLWLFHIICLL